ncbi:MAG: nucleoside triphosphate pyrophosphohydrolase [Bacteroidales bacterium]|nr:nucleoside triphosphate pyrophosphohydrolase [Bacteroidales bacterium]
MEIKHKKEVESFDRMLSLMEQVRKECPWDNAQTNDTLRTLTIEEIYELSEAILYRDNPNICKELGDVLMHVVFYALIGKENSAFDIVDVMNSLSEKLIRRHPHVFNKDKEWTAEEVAKNWEQIKLKEGNRSTLSGVPAHLPSLIKAYRITDKASGVGFDWINTDEVWDKVEEEIQELKQELDKPNNNEKINNEFGDVLMSLINYARFIGVNPDTALESSNRKFIRRFQYVEQKAKEQGKALKQMTLQEMDSLWQEAKQKGL